MSDGWPQVGMIGYHTGDWDADADTGVSLDAIRTQVILVERSDGSLGFVFARCDFPPDEEGRDRLYVHEFDPDEIKQTLSESLDVASKTERAQAEKSLALAAHLELLAAEARRRGL